MASENVEAGKPYLYENASTPATEMPAATPAMTVAVSNPDAVGDWQMKGTFQAEAFSDPEEYIYVLSNNQFFHSTNGTATVYPFRAYLKGIALGAGSKMEIVLDGDNPTKIDLNKIEGMEHLSGEMYNLQGVRVNDNYKGVVIVGGKKYLNK